MDDVMDFLDSEAGFRAACVLFTCVAIASLSTHGWRWIRVSKYKISALPTLPAAAPSAGLWFFSSSAHAPLLHGILFLFVIAVLPLLLHIGATWLATKWRQWMTLATACQNTPSASSASSDPQDTPQNASTASTTTSIESSAASTSHSTDHGAPMRLPTTVDGSFEYMWLVVVRDCQWCAQLVRRTAIVAFNATNAVLNANMYVFVCIFLIAWLVVWKTWLWSVALILFVTVIAGSFAVAVTWLASVLLFCIVYNMFTFVCPPLARGMEAIVAKWMFWAM
ncbi:hypothetical protein BC940DRAFT_337722 [Gongronella butleri]|nr:hypothetical protein BC940DRAFT_337722 [Gongronella butleri]